MHITPKRRRRVMHAHYLSQRGRSHRQIAEALKVSQATVRSDLQLVETHWSSLASATADDLLLESLNFLQLRLQLVVDQDIVGNVSGHLAPVEYLRARGAQAAQLNNLAREVRRTTHEVQQRAAQRPDQPDLYDEEPQEPAETTPELSKTDHPVSTISSPEQEIVQSQPAEEKIPADPIRPPVQLPRPTRNGAKPTTIHAAAAG
ncbi:MAG: hypothetical protein OXG27_09495 [Chloroflexi bacterium]|nr:hypothetical protein [Chloroflexota bacterium]